ncbi:MAG: CBS domain-containing protein [Chloroflexi bacterium]|nr:CBS domain-containing protein [Chloroflexota bacterium]
MKKARDIMTGTLITCSTDAPIAEAARLMRDGDTGNVLVTKDRKLVGIITDRDIALHMASEQDMTDVTAGDIMSSKIITGQANWDLSKVAEVMSKYQIRRLPILDDGVLVGIISVGDLARHDERNSRVAQTIKQISEPREVHRLHTKGRSWMWGLLGMITAIGMATILTRSPRTLRTIQKQVKNAHVADKVSNVWDMGLKQMAKSAFVAETVSNVWDKSRKRLNKRTSGIPLMTRAGSMRKRFMKMI